MCAPILVRQCSPNHYVRGWIVGWCNNVRASLNRGFRTSSTAFCCCVVRRKLPMCLIEHPRPTVFFPWCMYVPFDAVIGWMINHVPAKNHPPTQTTNHNMHGAYFGLPHDARTPPIWFFHASNFCSPVVFQRNPIGVFCCSIFFVVPPFGTIEPTISIFPHPYPTIPRRLNNRQSIAPMRPIYPIFCHRVICEHLVINQFAFVII